MGCGKYQMCTKEELRIVINGENCQYIVTSPVLVMILDHKHQQACLLQTCSYLVVSDSLGSFIHKNLRAERNISL